MKPRIVALLLGAAALGLGLAWWQERHTGRELAAQVSRLSRHNADLNYELKQAAKRAAEVTQRAIELDTQLGTAKARTTTTVSRQVQLTRELTETKAILSDQEHREVALMAELATLRQKVAEAGAPSTAPAPTPAPAVDLTTYNRRIAELEQQLTQLLARALAESALEPAPAQAVTHQVVRVGPRDAFVVLDYGREHGARTSDIITVQRGTSAVAQVQISDARPRFSLAQVLPGSLKGPLQSGDLLVLTN